ncbi:hypothetical protein L6452_00067 [Arctium lappa]|uniref:Uncharacterized protein n=1 Tax=Arctium lappa TaxID=4217 RepID=A0ACB9FE44_ARCLA|nr:hypothetical protein L6452_00067 [Arctium lappa]
MADFEPPSFSLGLDCDDSDRQISSVTQDPDPSSSNQLSIPAATLKDDDFETLIVSDSEPDYPDPHPNRLRHLFTVSANTKLELHSSSVVDDKNVDTFSSRNNMRTDEQNRKQIVSNGHESVLTSCNNLVLPKLNISPLGKFQLIDSDTDDPSVIDAKNWQCNAHCYYFHDDSRIQELVRKRLPNFSPLGNRDLNHHHLCTSTIDYMGQFSHGERSDRNIRDKKSSSSRKISKRSKIEEGSHSQGWVNPKLGFDKGLTKGATKRKVRVGRRTAGHWLTDPVGKKVYVSKMGEELSGKLHTDSTERRVEQGLKGQKRGNLLLRSRNE